MGTEIVSNQGEIAGAASAVDTARSGFSGATSPDKGGSNGQGFDAMVALSSRIHPLIERVSSSLGTEATAVKDMARTFDETDRKLAEHEER